MNYQDRRQIDNCINDISSKIDMRILWPRLLEKRVFYLEDVNVAAWQNVLHRRETAREILETIKTRGPQAFKNLVLSLRETRHDGAADILEGRIPIVSNENQVNNNGERSRDFTTEDDWYFKTKFLTTSEPLVIDVKRATRFMDELDATSSLRKYYMRKKPHGYVLIITIKAYITEPVRKAAEHDQENLKKLFTDMGFEVIVPDPPTNFTGAEINKIVREFSKRNFDKVDSCFVIISAHGNAIQHRGSWETEIHGIDYNMEGAEKVLCSELVNMFTAEHCKLLIGKPKVFIFQACRGEAEQLTSRYAADGSDSQAPRNYSDILIANSTIPGHKAYRDEFNGSWYIQILCEVFMRHACDMHIADLFNKVDEKLMTIRTLDGRAQTSTVKTMGFSQHLYLNPGIFDNS